MVSVLCLCLWFVVLLKVLVGVFEDARSASNFGSGSYGVKSYEG